MVLTAFTSSSILIVEGRRLLIDVPLSSSFSFLTDVMQRSNRDPFVSCSEYNENSDTLRTKHNLFCFGEVCDVSEVVDAAHVEPSTSSLAAESRYQTRLRLSLRDVDRTYLDATAHHFQQPLITVHVVMFQMQVQRSIPAIHK